MPQEENAMDPSVSNCRSHDVRGARAAVSWVLPGGWLSAGAAVCPTWHQCFGWGLYQPFAGLQRNSWARSFCVSPNVPAAPFLP